MMQVAGVSIPDTDAAVEANTLVADMMNTPLMQHSQRVYVFAELHARRLGLRPNSELLFVSALFHDAGLLTPATDTAQRFEIDGADHARAFLEGRGFSPASADIVWAAIALHTTPAIPVRMEAEIAMLNLGVLTDVIGVGKDALDPGHVNEIVAAFPRGDFKKAFLDSVVEGLRDRPETANGTVNSDILEHFLPDLHRTTTVERVLNAPWPS